MDPDATGPEDTTHVCPHCRAGADKIEFVQFTRLSYKVVQVNRENNTVLADGYETIDYSAITDEYVYCLTCGKKLEDWEGGFA